MRHGGAARVLLWVLAACVGGSLAACVSGCGGGQPQTPPAPPAATSPTGGHARVVIVGIDGADWQLIRPLVEQGRMPAFKRILSEGAAGVLRSMEPSASPSLWTTVATGVGPDRHGIHGFVVSASGETESEAGADPDAAPGGGAPGAGSGLGGSGKGAGSARDPGVRPVTSSMRRAPAFWNILTEQGLKVGVVGWLVTWPAEPVNGYVVSSYLPYVYNWSTGRPLKGTIVQGIPHQTFPEGLIDELQPLKVKPADLDDATLKRFYDPARLAVLPPADRECVEGFRWSLACDETFRRAALHLFDRYPVDLFAVYFGGVDVASHRFWKFAFPKALNYGVKAEEAAILGGVIDAYYAYVDGVVGEYLSRLGPDDTLVILSDHGFKPVLIPGRPNTSGHHRMEGILALWGRGVRRGARIENAGLLDVLPTVLNLLDQPIAMDLEGHIIEAALDPRFALEHRPKFVEAYAQKPRPDLPDQSDLDRNVLERLRSLGYIN